MQAMCSVLTCRPRGGSPCWSRHRNRAGFSFCPRFVVVNALPPSQANPVQSIQFFECLHVPVAKTRDQHRVLVAAIDAGRSATHRPQISHPLAGPKNRSVNRGAGAKGSKSVSDRRRDRLWAVRRVMEFDHRDVVSPGRSTSGRAPRAGARRSRAKTESRRISASR